MSDLFAREAWRLIEANYERVLRSPDDMTGRSAMLLGAHLAGIAIEHSMLGATHACANPLTKRYGTTHGLAIAVMLPHVVRWNAESVGDRYGELLRVAEHGDGLVDRRWAGERLAERLEALAGLAGLPPTLRDVGVSHDDLHALAADAAAEWTGTFNPRQFDAAAAFLCTNARTSGLSASVVQRISERGVPAGQALLRPEDTPEYLGRRNASQPGRPARRRCTNERGQATSGHIGGFGTTTLCTKSQKHEIQSRFRLSVFVAPFLAVMSQRGRSTASSAFGMHPSPGAS